MDIELLHGYGGGDGNNVKFVKVTSSATAPISPTIYDIWIKDSSAALNQLYFYQNQPILNTNDVLIGVANNQSLFKINLDKGSNHTELPINTTGVGQKYLQTTYFDAYGYYTIVKKNVAGTITIMPAYYWNGSSWIQFSFDDEYALCERRMSSDIYNWTIFKASDLTIHGEVIKDNASYTQKWHGYDSERNILMFGSGVSSTKVLKETDVFLNTIKTVTLGARDNVFFKNNKYYNVSYLNSRVLIHDVTDGTNTLVYTTTNTVSGYKVEGIKLSNDKNILYAKMASNGSPNGNHFIFNISNMLAITETLISSSGPAMYAICIEKDVLIVPKSASTVIALEERSLDGDTLIKTVTTTLSNSVGSYNYRNLIGKDSEGCYYAAEYSTVGGTKRIYKISPTGSLIYSVDYVSATGAYTSAFTAGQRLLVATTSKTLSLLNNLDGSISISDASAYAGVTPYSFNPGNISSNSN